MSKYFKSLESGVQCKTVKGEGASITKDLCLTCPEGSLLAILQLTSRIFGDILAVCQAVPVPRYGFKHRTP